MEILLAAFAGYMFAQVLLLQRMRALAIGERFIEQNQADGARNMQESFDQMLGQGSPVRLAADRETLMIEIEYVSKLCPGPHRVYMSKDVVLDRQHLAIYVGKRIEAGRFTRITIEW